MTVPVLFLSLIVGCSTHGSPLATKSQNKRPPSSSTNSAQGGSRVGNPSGNDGSKTLDCEDPKGYSLEEGTVPGINSVNIVRGRTVLHTIELLTDRELNGFGFNGAKKTKEGFEIAIEYGTRIYYGKTFIFICRQHKFYLSRIRVETFDRQNPEKWRRKVIRVRPNVPLEKFLITDFTLPIMKAARLSWPRRMTHVEEVRKGVSYPASANRSGIQSQLKVEAKPGPMTRPKAYRTFGRLLRGTFAKV